VRVNRRLVMGKTAEISINRIFPNPDYPRKEFDPAKIYSSIKSFGL